MMSKKLVFALLIVLVCWQSAEAVTVSRVNTLSIPGSPGAWTGTLNMNNNGLIVQGANALDAATKYATHLDQLKSGRNGGDWGAYMLPSLPTGIASGTAADWQLNNGIEGVQYGVVLNGLRDSNGLGPGAFATYGGFATDANSIIFQYCWSGDANFDGRVDGDDLTLYDLGVAFAGDPTMVGYSWGDFNLDGIIDGDDLTLYDLGVAFQPPLAAGASASAVPEPTTLGLILVGFVSALVFWVRRRA